MPWCEHDIGKRPKPSRMPVLVPGFWMMAYTSSSVFITNRSSECIKYSRKRSRHKLTLS